MVGFGGFLSFVSFFFFFFEGKSVCELTRFCFDDDSYVLALSENRPERSQILSNTLLPFLRKEEENPGPRVGETLAKRQRQVLFGWFGLLLSLGFFVTDLMLETGLLV